MEEHGPRIWSWHVRHRTPVFCNKWYTLLRDEIVRHDGTIIDYYVSKRPDIVTAFIITNDNHVLLVNQYRHGIRELSVELPMGCVDTNESPRNAIIRELREETGYQCSNLTCVTVLNDDPARNTNRVYVYVGHNASHACQPHLDVIERDAGLHTISVHINDILQLITNSVVRSTTSIAAIHCVMMFLNRMSQHKFSDGTVHDD